MPGSRVRVPPLLLGITMRHPSGANRQHLLGALQALEPDDGAGPHRGLLESDLSVGAHRAGRVRFAGEVDDGIPSEFSSLHAQDLSESVPRVYIRRLIRAETRDLIERAARLLLLIDSNLIVRGARLEWLRPQLRDPHGRPGENGESRYEHQECELRIAHRLEASV